MLFIKLEIIIAEKTNFMSEGMKERTCILVSDKHTIRTTNCPPVNTSKCPKLSSVWHNGYAVHSTIMWHLMEPIYKYISCTLLVLW